MSLELCFLQANATLRRILTLLLPGSDATWRLCKAELVFPDISNQSSVYTVEWSTTELAKHPAWPLFPTSQ